MPTYEYKCEACGNLFEKFQPMSSKPVRKCPKCGKLKVRRLVSSGAGLIFKGSGFYITDYRSEGYKSAAKADGGGGADKSSESSSSGAAKPAESKPAEPKPAATKPAESKSASSSSAKPESKKK